MVKKTKNKTDRLYISHTADYLYPEGYDLQELKEKAEYLLKEWGSDAKLEYDQTNDDGSYKVLVSRLETDEEYAGRLELEDMYKENRRRQYEVLKQEFE